MAWVRGESIGCGSFSTVNLARPGNNSADFYHPLMAVKSCDVYHSALLENEKEILNQLGVCPQIIRCLGDNRSFENGENLYNLLLEYAQGGSLEHHLKISGGRSPEVDVKRYTRSILKGLLYIHAKGFVHCDIKLQNILIFGNGEVKIADFGLAKKAGEKRKRVEIRGTPLYMSPESVKANVYESPCDIWALGCAVIEMVTGKSAWNSSPAKNVAALLIRIGVGDELPAFPGELSEEGKDFLSKCFVKDPTKRWTAEMLLDHPFVTDDGDDTDTVPLEGSEELPASPRCHFDFSEWVSGQSSPKCELWFEGEVKSTFDVAFPSSLSSAADRIRQLASDQTCHWSDSGSWVAVR